MPGTVCARLSRFSTRGDFIDVRHLLPPVPSGLAVGATSDGTLIITGQWRASRARDGQGLLRDTIAVIGYRPAGETDTLTLAAGREFVQRADETGRMMMGIAVFGRRTSTAIWNDALVVGDQVTHAVRVFEPQGTVRELRWSGPDLRLRDADVASWIAQRVAAAPSSERTMLRALLESAPRPAMRPAYGRLMATASGYLLAGEYTTDVETAWTVFDPNGRWLGTLRVPDGFRLLDIGADWVIGTQRDERDAEQLVLRAIAAENR